MKIDDITGVIPALITTFDHNGIFDEKRQRTITRFLLSEKIGALYLTGSTGEAFLMNEAERMRVVEVVAEENANKVPLIVHVGAIGTKNSIALAKHAKANGARAISSVPPFYYKFTADEIYGYYDEITQASGLPMIIYNISLANLMGNALIERLASIDGVAGLKFTGTELFSITELKNALGDTFMIYSGCDEMATQGLLSGADGIIGSFYNLLPKAFVEIYQAVQENRVDVAMRIQRAATSFILKTLPHGHFGVIKEMLTAMGVDAGTVRLPFIHPSPEVMNQLWDYVMHMEDGELLHLVKQFN